MKKIFLIGFLAISLLLFGCAQEDLPPEPPAPGETGSGAFAGQAIAGGEGFAVFDSPAAQSSYFKVDFGAFPEGARGIFIAAPGDTYVYKIGYASINNAEWVPFKFDQETVGGSNWIRGDASTLQRLSPTEVGLAEDSNGFIAYACSKKGGSWDCHGNKWMLWQFGVEDMYCYDGAEACPAGYVCDTTCFGLPDEPVLPPGEIDLSGTCNIWLGMNLENLFYYDGTSWTTARYTNKLGNDLIDETTGVPIDSAQIDSMWGISKNDIWATKQRDLIRFDGALWHDAGSTPSVPGASTSILGETILGISPNDIWLVGRQGEFFHYDGSSWAFNIDVWGGINELWGTYSNDIWAVGNRIFHFDGASWSQVLDYSYTYALEGIWGSSNNDIWAVGHEGALLHYDGASWSKVNSGTTEKLLDVWGSGPNDVWVIGGINNGIILHYDGTTWLEFSYPPVKGLHTIIGNTASDISVVAFTNSDDLNDIHTEILHFDGTSWSKEKNYVVINSPKAIWNSCS